MDNLLASKQASKQELENITYVKTILMLLIVLYHSIIFYGGNWFSAVECLDKSRLISAFSVWLNTFHIYGFAMCSGYLYSYMFYEKRKYRSFLSFLKNKCTRLIVPFFFVCIIWVVPITQFFYRYDLATLVLKYALATNPSQLWYLWMIFDVFIIVWPLSKLIKNDYVAIVVCIVSFVVGIVGGRYLTNYFCMWTAFAYLPYFVLGIKLRQKPQWIIRKIHPIIYVVLDCILFIAWIIISMHSGTIMKIGTFIVECSLHIVGALMIFFVIQKLASSFPYWKENKIFMFISKCSMTIYLFHQQVIYFTIAWLNGKANPYINAIVNFFAALIVSLMISLILTKFKTTRFLIGER